MLKKVGSWIGTAKKHINNIQNEVSNIDLEDNNVEKKDKKMTHDEKDGGFISHLAELRKRLIHSFIFDTFLLDVIILQKIYMAFS